MDENQVSDQQAENTGAVEDNSVDTSPVDETTTSESTETDRQPSSAEEIGEGTDGDTERKPSRAERRIRQLSSKLQQQGQPNQPPQGITPPPQAPLQPPMPGEEFSSYEDYARKYQGDVVQAADTIATIRTQEALQQFQAKSNLDRDVEVVPQIYPELNEDSDQFNPVIYDKVEAEFQKRAFRNGQLDPSVRLADVAKDFVEVARAAAEKSTAQMKNAVAKTNDEAAIRPSGKTPQDKPVSEMSIKEIEAKYGFAQQ